jgi:hypothetical protein
MIVEDAHWVDPEPGSVWPDGRSIMLPVLLIVTSAPSAQRRVGSQESLTLNREAKLPP